MKDPEEEKPEKQPSIGFAAIGIGLMILCICYGCQSCERSKVELDIMKAKARVEVPDVRFTP